MLTGPVEAGGTISVERGSEMPYLHWALEGVPNCIPSFSGNPYPDNSGDASLHDQVMITWLSASKSGVGTEVFNNTNPPPARQRAQGNPSQAFPQSYVFKCSHTLPSAVVVEDITTLIITDCVSPRVWNNTTKQCEGAGPKLVVCPDNPTMNTNSTLNLQAYYWPNRVGAPTCADTAEPQAQNVTQLAAWGRLLGTAANVTDVAPNKGLVTSNSNTTSGIPVIFQAVYNSQSDTTGVSVVAPPPTINLNFQ